MIQRLSEYLLIAGLFFLPISVTLDNLILISAVLSIMLFIHRPFPVDRSVKIILFIGLLFWLWMLLSSFVFNDPSQKVFKYLSKYFRAGMVFLGTTLLMCQSKIKQDTLLNAFTYGCLPAVVLANFSIIFWLLGFSGISHSFEKWHYGYSVARLSFGIMTSVALMYLVHRYVSHRKKLDLCLIGMFSSYMLFSSIQRLTILLWVMLMVYLVALNFKFSIRKKVLSLGILMVLFGLFVLYGPSRNYEVFKKMLDHFINPETTMISESISTRIFLHKVCFQMFFEKMYTGFGIGSFKPYLNQNFPGVLNVGDMILEGPESSYAHFIAELGLVGICIFLAWLGVIFYRMIKLHCYFPYLGGWVAIVCAFSTDVIVTFFDHSASMFFMAILSVMVSKSLRSV